MAAEQLGETWAVNSGDTEPPQTQPCKQSIKITLSPRGVLSEVSDTAEEPPGSATGEELEGQPSSSGSNAQSRSGNAIDPGKSRPVRSKSTPVKQGEK